MDRGDIFIPKLSNKFHHGGVRLIRRCDMATYYIARRKNNQFYYLAGHDNYGLRVERTWKKGKGGVFVFHSDDEVIKFVRSHFRKCMDEIYIENTLSNK